MPNKIHLDILNENQKKLLPLIGLFHDKFYLVGGTAIALQLGHRRSIDFDLFSYEAIDQRKIRNKIIKNYRIDRVIIDDKDEFTVLADGVKLTFLHYPFKIRANKKLNEYIKMPDLATLAAMKSYALGRRAKWKDYADLYWIMNKQSSILAIMKKAKAIFASEFNEKNFREQLAYFKDIDYSEEIDWLPGFKVSDQQIQKALMKYSLEE